MPEEINQQKKFELLVIEDTLEFLTVAKDVYGKDNRLNPSYVSTYESALSYLQSNKVDIVISDMFFPSQVDWKEYFLSDIKYGRLEDLVKKGELEESTLASYSQNKGSLERLNIDYADFEGGPPVSSIRDYKNIQENPAGLGIALYCLKNRIPFVLLSQYEQDGSRHRGAIGILRYALQYSQDFRDAIIKGLTDVSREEDGKYVESNPKEALPELLHYGGVVNVDKNTKEIWKEAIEGIILKHEEYFKR